MGRNRVMRADTSRVADNEIGSGAKRSVSGIGWQKLSSEPLLSQEFQTQTPVNVLAEKIRCVVPELNGQVSSNSERHIEFACQAGPALNRKEDVSFLVAIEMQRADSPEDGKGQAMTFLRIVILPAKTKWFAWKNVANKETAMELMTMIRQYLSLNEETSLLKVNAAVTKSTRDTPPS